MLTPGPELDALVAEKVMGWRRDRTLFRRQDGYGPFAFSPSTSIEDAWEVVERIRDHFQHSVEVWACNSNQYKVTVALAPYPNAAEAYAPTAPHAICLAALKAVGVEVHA